MDAKRFSKYLQKQKDEIEKHKWIESEKAGKDLGQDAVLDWIKKYAKKFRKEYVEKDLETAIKELDELLKLINGKVNGIEKLKTVINDCKEKIEEAKDLMEGNGNGKEDKK